MCWNAEVSLQSFLIGGLAIFVAYQNGLSFPVTLFCLTIICMQLVEYVVWTYYDEPTVNFQASVVAAFLLWLQPIASILTLSSPAVAVAVYSGLSLFLQWFDTKPLRETYKMFRGDNGHLVWNWLQPDLQTTLSLTVYFFFLFFPLLLTKQYTLLTVALGTLGLSLTSFYKDNTWGSMWCWIVNYLVVFVCGRQILIAKP